MQDTTLADLLEMINEAIKGLDFKVEKHPCRHKLLKTNEHESAIVNQCVNLWLSGAITWDKALDLCVEHLKDNISNLAKVDNLYTVEELFSKIDDFVHAQYKLPKMSLVQKERELDHLKKYQHLLNAEVMEVPLGRSSIDDIDVLMVQKNNVEWAKIESILILSSFYNLLFSVKIKLHYSPALLA